MEHIKIDKDIKVFYIQAKSFPDGVMEAHQKMHSLNDFSSKRKSFGISRPENGEIVYKVASEELESGDLSKHNLEEFIIKRGQYVGITIKNFRNDISSIKKAFDKITANSDIDPNGYFIEWYQGMDDVICMVKLK